MPSLLPLNRTPLETALSLAIGPRLFDATLPLAGFKTEPTDGLVPWLVWEYGLDELLPYLTDPRRALREGIQFQRLRGTVASLRMALGWIGYDAAILEEAGPGPWWAELQIDPGAVPSDEDVRRIVGVAGLALPTRARLVRLYHGYDFRPIILDQGPALDAGMLDDDSGTDANGVRLSFGRTVGLSVDSDVVDPALALHSVTGLAALYDDAEALDWWRLDSEVVRNYPVAMSWIYGCSGAELAEDLGPIAAGVRLIAKANIVLDDTRLDSPTALLDPTQLVEEGAPLTLDGEERLDSYVHSVRREPLDEVLLDTVSLGADTAIVPSASFSMQATIALRAGPEMDEVVLDGDLPELVGWRITATLVVGADAGPYRPLWPTARWGNHTWDDPVISIGVWMAPVEAVGPDEIGAWTIAPWTQSDGGHMWAGGWQASLTPPSDSGV